MRALILARLPYIFPVGSPNRNFSAGDLAADSIFTMLFAGAVEGRSTLINPIHIFRRKEKESQVLIRRRSLQLTLSLGLIPPGAVKILSNVHPNSLRPKYYLEGAFAELFDPELSGHALNSAFHLWQKEHFSKKTLALIRLIEAAVTQLPARQKQSFLMTRYEHYFRQEAADQLG